MGWVAFLVAVVYVCLGFAAGTLLSRRRNAAAAAAHPPAEADDRSFNMRGDQAADFLERIHKLASNVDSGVDRHSTRVAEISGGLAGDERLTVTAAAAAAEKLLEANQQLQQDLASAKEELQAQRRLLDSYMVESLTDPLTGLGNRRKFNQELARRFAQWRTAGNPLSVVLADVDHFKSVNDTHGHAAGDAVLHEVAHAISECVREMDVVARYGGEEFGVILPGTSVQEARPIAERIRRAIAGRTFQYGVHELLITVSAGLAEAVLTNDVDALVARADAALYAAKDAGRDRCYLHDGQACVEIEKTSGSARRKTDCAQRIAPFVDGKFPDSEMFYSIACEELSPQGFTFLAPERPAYDKVLLAPNEGKTHAFMSATVQHCREIGTDATPLYRVSCQFTVPADRFAEAGA